jgi:hypothetical protein
MALFLTVGWSLPRVTYAQNSPNRHSVSGQRQGEPNPVPEAKIFKGKIVRSGDKLVLTDSTTKKTYQLDDQEKAQQFLDKRVRVKGVLDAVTGTIRITSIEPAA